MKKTLTILAAAVTITVAALAAPTNADARDGGAVAAGVIGGLAAGAIIGSAVRGPGYYGSGYYGPGYGSGPAYYASGPYYGSSCYVQRQRVWNGYAWRLQRVRVCN
jgi:hypothetical protein